MSTVPKPFVPVKIDDDDVRIVPDHPMPPHVFRQRLAQLLDDFLQSGGDPFWLNQELNLQGMQAVDNLRADLVDTDEEGGAE